MRKVRKNGKERYREPKGDKESRRRRPEAKIVARLAVTEPGHSLPCSSRSRHRVHGGAEQNHGTPEQGFPVPRPRFEPSTCRVRTYCNRVGRGEETGNRCRCEVRSAPPNMRVHHDLSTDTARGALVLLAAAHRGTPFRTKRLACSDFQRPSLGACDVRTSHNVT